MGRTLPTYCPHGVCIDYGDFGPDPDNESSESNVTCPQCVRRQEAILLNDVSSLMWAVGTIRVLLIPVDSDMDTEQAVHAHGELSAMLPHHRVVFVAGMRGNATEITYTGT